MVTNKANDTDLIGNAIKQAVQRDTEQAYDDMKKKLIEDLDREKDTIVAGVVLNVMKLVNYETVGQNLVITVKKIEK